jgi:hypothetical protein
MRPRGAAPGTHRRLLLRRIVGVKAEMLRTAPIRRSWTIAMIQKAIETAKLNQEIIALEAAWARPR